MDYQVQFETLSNCVFGLPSDALLYCFISGLRTEIQRELAILQPSTLSQATGWAKLLEAKLNDSRPTFHRNPHRQPTSSNNTTPPSLLDPGPQNPLPIRYINRAQIQERRAKGLCYNCDDKFVRGHKCKSKQFLLLRSEEPDVAFHEGFLDAPTAMDPPPDPGPTPLPQTQTVDPPIDGAHFQLSQAALIGPPSPKTLRVQGQIHELLVTVLIDSGSSHNIMQPRVAEFLQLPVVAMTPFSVIVGNGDSIVCSGSCREVPHKLSEQLFTIPFYVLPIHGADLVLGVQRLQTLGPFLFDYSVPFIQFSYNNTPITIRGSSPSTPT